MLGVSPGSVSRLRRHGLLVSLDGKPSYSRADVQAVVEDPWLDGAQAAKVLGVGRTRVLQLAQAERIPSWVSPLGRRFYRRQQLEVVARARAVRFHSQRLA